MAKKTLNPDRNRNQNTVRKIPDLPNEVIQEILSRLPLDSLFRSKYVCKLWEALFNCPETRLMHYKQSCQKPKPTNLILISLHERKRSLHFIPELDLNSPRIKKEAIRLREFEFDSRFLNFSLVGSCNGFLCFADFNSEDLSVLVCNPVIDYWFNLPAAPPHYACVSLCGFGYNPKKDEYKLIRKRCKNIDILTVGTSSWRTIDLSLLTRLMEDKLNFRMDDVSKAFVNGCLHWLHFGHNKVADIISWDVDTEEFGRISVPAAVKDMVGFNYLTEMRACFPYHLAVMRGCLSVVVNCNEENLAVVWVMNKYGDEGSWVPEFVIPRPWKGKMVQVLGMENDNIILQCDGKGLYSYDPERRKRKFRVSGLPKKFNAYPHTGTLVELKDVISFERS